MAQRTDTASARGRSVASAGRRPPLQILGIATVIVVLGLLVLVACRRVINPADGSSPHVGFTAAEVDTPEGDVGTTPVSITVALDAPARTTVTVTLATADATARAADADYEPLRRTVTFRPGQRTQIVTVTVVGDSRLEDYETLTVRLSAATGASLGRATERIRILNDERPPIVIDDVSIGEGGVGTFRPRLTRRFDRRVIATVTTVDASAQAPGDYESVVRTITFPAGSSAPQPVAVATAADAPAEPPESFGLRVQSVDPGRAITAVGTIVETQCPSGAPAAVPAFVPSPPSPSAPRPSGPPASVTGTKPWDVVFADDFDRAATTAAKWSTGMRSGAMTLADNHELEWYSPRNSIVTTDLDGGARISVLQQRVTSDPVRGQYYPVGVLSRLYPPARCPQYYDPHRLAPDDPSLVPYRFRSGMLNSSAHFGFTYGYVEARVKMPKGFALWPALWLRDWQRWSYELDAFEGFDAAARTVRGTFWWGDGAHVSTASGGGDLGILLDGSGCRANVAVAAHPSEASGCPPESSVDLSSGYHTIGLNWTSSRYEMYVDGTKRWTSPPGTPIASTPNHLILDLAFGNDTDEFDWIHTPVRPLDAGVLSAASFPKPTIEWDYVKVWQPAGEHAVCSTGNC